MQEGIGIVDFNEKIIFCNTAFDKIFGFGDSGMIGQNLKDFIFDEELHLIFKESTKRKEDKKSQYNLNIIRKDKSKRIIYVSSVPWKNINNEI